MSKKCAFPDCEHPANPNSKHCAFHADDLEYAYDNLILMAKLAVNAFEQGDSHIITDNLYVSLRALQTAVEIMDSQLAIAQRQADMQAADTYEAQFVPIESFDSAEGSPICPECGAIMLAEYDGNERIIGYDCAACAYRDEPYQEPCDDCGRYHESDEPCYGHTPYMPEWFGRDVYASKQYILDSIADERASEESYHWWLEGLYNSPKYLDYLTYLREEWRI